MGNVHRSVGERVGWFAAGVGLVASCAVLVLKATRAGTAEFDRLVGWANIGSLVLVVLGFAAVAFRRHSDSDIPASRSLQDCESFLASSTLVSEGAERARLIGRGPLVAQALDIDYRTAPTDTSSKSSRAGSFQEILKFYGRTKSRRLVILGEAGSGKTVLALNLLVDMSQLAVSGAEQTDNLPLIPLQLHASVLLGPGDLNSCLAQALSDRLRVPGRVANQIVQRGRIVPFIDGLDEIEVSPRAAGPLVRVIDKLNEHVVGTDLGPLVVTCRADTYERLLAADHGIRSGTAVRISDLTPRQCLRYFESRAPLRSPNVGEWVTHLRDQVGSDQERAKVLFSSIRTPWRLTLLLAAVADGLTVARFLDVYPSSDDLDASSACDQRTDDEVLDLLLSRYVPSAITFSGNGRFSDVEDATRWLGFLSRTLSCGPSSTPEINIVPRNLWKVGGERAARLVDTIVWTLPLTGLLAAGNWALIGSTLAHPRQVGWALAIALGGSAYIYYKAAGAIYRRDPEPLVLRVELPASIKQELAVVRREAFWQGARSGLGLGLFFGIGIFLVPFASPSVADPAQPFGYRFVEFLVFGVVVAVLVAVGNAGLRYLVNRRYVALEALPARTNYITLCLVTLARFFVAILLAALLLTGGMVVALLRNGLGSPLSYPAVLWQAGPTLFLFGVSLSIVLLVIAYGATFVADFAGLAFASRFLSGLLVAGVRRRFPFRAQSFLYWCWRAEILRTSGGVYQFKHLQLQRWLCRGAASGDGRQDPAVAVRGDRRREDEKASVDLG